jgi:glutathione S-transferase
MKLYYAPGACSLSPHIVLLEAGLQFEHEKVDLATKQTASGRDFNTISPKGYVPLLELDDGTMLSEGAAIVQYLADHAAERQLAPPAGTIERVRLQEWLSFISSELHKNFSPLFNPAAGPEWKAAAVAVLARRLAHVAAHLERQPYLLGSSFSVADAYLFTVLNWGQWVKLDLAQWPVLQAYHARVADRRAVQAAMQQEGLLG